MHIKQLTVFMENVAGRLQEIVGVLGSNGINIVSLTLADTNEFGIARFIVSDPDKGYKLLKEAGFTSRLSRVFAVKINNRPGMLESILTCINNSGAGIEYLYVLSTGDVAGFIIKLDNDEKIFPFIENHDIILLDEETVYNMN